ncbi:hypothetical protein ACFWP5_48855 [Streptomyces sp. NPDC058469]
MSRNTGLDLSDCCATDSRLFVLVVKVFALVAARTGLREHEALTADRG